MNIIKRYEKMQREWEEYKSLSLPPFVTTSTKSEEELYDKLFTYSEEDGWIGLD